MPRPMRAEEKVSIYDALNRANGRSTIFRTIGRQKNGCDRKMRQPWRFAVGIERTRRLHVLTIHFLSFRLHHCYAVLRWGKQHLPSLRDYRSSYDVRVPRTHVRGCRISSRCDWGHVEAVPQDRISHRPAFQFSCRTNLSVLTCGVRNMSTLEPDGLGIRGSTRYTRSLEKLVRSSLVRSIDRKMAIIRNRLHEPDHHRFDKHTGIREFKQLAH